MGVRPCVLTCVALSAQVILAAPTDLKNLTLEVPDGATSYPQTHTLCLPPSAIDILLFFFANYVAHAATIKSYPGDSTFETFYNVLFALLCPPSGVIRALNAIFRCASLAGNELERAARAGALCMVVRNRDWQPVLDMEVRDMRIAHIDGLDTGTWNASEKEPDEPDENGRRCLRTRMNIVTAPKWAQDVQKHRRSDDARSDTLHDFRKIQGVQSLPTGYTMAYVPRDAKVYSFYDNDDDDNENRRSTGKARKNIASSYGFPKALIAIVQTIYAAITLYRVRGDQLAKYGYAAFGLTVTPYLLMSVINLIAHVATPDYPTLYLVRSDVMTEAEHRGGYFDGVIGILRKASQCESFSCRFVSPDGEGGDKVPEVAHLQWTDASSQAKALPTNVDEVSVDLKIEESFTRGQVVVFVPACGQFERTQHTEDDPWDQLTSFPRAQKGWNNHGSSSITFALTTLLAALPLAIIGAISHFERGDSTSAQRGWTMSWLVVSILSAQWVRSMSKILVDDSREDEFLIRAIGGFFASIVVLGPFFAPAVGGLVVVGQMLVSFGSCTRLY